MRQATSDQLAALQAFARKYGRNWKQVLRDKWFDGRDANEPDGYLLRQIRNQLGPTWLRDVCPAVPDPRSRTSLTGPGETPT